MLAGSIPAPRAEATTAWYVRGMVAYDVVVRGEPVTVTVRFGIYEHSFKGLTIMDVMAHAVFLPGFESAIGATPFGENGGERAFTPCTPDRRLIDGETIELMRVPATPKPR